jgi:hypothetical protein
MPDSWVQLYAQQPDLKKAPRRYVFLLKYEAYGRGNFKFFVLHFNSVYYTRIFMIIRIV